MPRRDYINQWSKPKKRKRGNATRKDKKIAAIINDLRRCAKQNEADSRAPGGFDSRDCLQAAAVAAEQRRMIKVLSLKRS